MWMVRFSTPDLWLPNRKTSCIDLKRPDNCPAFLFQVNRVVLISSDEYGFQTEWIKEFYVLKVWWVIAALMTGKLTLSFMRPIRISSSVSTQKRLGQIGLAFLVSFVVLMAAGPAFSQFDYKFWMPPIWQTGDSQHNEPSELFITTPYPTPVNVHVETPDGTTFVFDGTVTTGTPLIIPLTPTLGQTNIANTIISNNGFIITSEKPIQCVHRVSAFFNQTLVTLKGQNAIGRDFWCGSQVRNNASNYGPNEQHFITVMALENNTQITFQTPFDLWQSGAGDLPNPYTINLNRHQCYLVRSDVHTEHVSGARVTSNKDIVVISGSTHTRISGPGANAADGGTDQLVPVELIGTDYAVIKGQNSNTFDYVIVVAREANTQVFINGSGTPSATIGAGQFFDWSLTGTLGTAHSIRTSKPAYLYHVTGASNDDEVDMGIMPNLDCTGSRYIEFSRFTTNTSIQILQVLAPDDAWPTLRLNNVLYSSVPGVIVNTIPGLPGWRAITFPNSSVPADCILRSDGFFHAGWLTGTTNNTGAYGYLSGFDDSFEILDPVSQLPTNIYNLGQICQGQSIDHCVQVISCEPDVELTAVANNSGSVVVAPPTAPFDTCFRYTAPFNFTGNDTITFTATNIFGYEDSFEIVFEVVNPNTPIDAGPNQVICDVSSTTLSAVNPDPLADGYWTVAQGTGVIANPNSSMTTVSNLSPGINLFVWNQAYPSCGVINTDIVQVLRYQGNPPAANAGPDVNLCGSSNYTMQANSPGFSGLGTWEILSGNATIFNINSATALVTNLGLGVNTFRWNISNGACPGDDTNDVMVINVFNPNHPPANAGSDQTVCQGSFTFLNINGSIPQVPATGQWSVISGTATFGNANSANTTVSGLSVGVNILRWTITNGPCGTLTDDVVITVFNPASPTANAGQSQSICLPANSTTLAANTPISPATGTWTVVQGTGSFSNVNAPNAAVSGLSLGVNVFQWTINNGPCANSVTSSQVTITVFPDSQPTPDAGQDQQLCFTGSALSTVLTGTTAIAPGAGSWSVVNGSGVFSSPNQPTTTVSGLGLGTNTFQWTLTNGTCDPAVSDQVVVTVFNSAIPPANAGPDASLCLPLTSHTMQATAAIFPSSGSWSLVSGAGTIANPNSPTSQINNLGVGQNVFRWTINNGPCAGVNFDEVVITVFSNVSPPANAGTDLEACFQGAIPVQLSLNGNTPLSPATGIWTVVSGGGSIISPNSPTSQVSGLPVGVSVFQWTVDNGACGSTSDQVSVTVYNPSQSPADAGPDQEICSTTTQINLSANALIAPATGQWTIVSGSGVFANAFSPNTTVTGLSIGQNIFQWTIDNGPCASPITLSDQVTVTVFNSAQTPAAAGPDQSICSSIAQVSLNANTLLLPATGQWTVVSGTGVFSNPTSPVTNVTGMSVGINTYQWEVFNGPCNPSSADQLTVTVFDQNAVSANAGADQAFCLPVTSSAFAGSVPTFPATGLWSLVSGAGVIGSPGQFNSSVSGLALGENIFQWTINNGACGTITSDQMSIFIFDSGQSLPDAGPDAQICTPQSTYTMQGNAISFPAQGTWTLVSGTGTIADPNNPVTTISGLGVGESVFRWSISNGPCPVGFAFDEMSIFVFDQNQPNANAGPDQLLCATGVSPVSAQMAASSVIAPGSGVWTLISGTGTIVSPTSPLTVINALGVGENIFRWTVNNGPCANGTTFDEISVFVYPANQAAANAGPDQELCSNNATTSFAANVPVFPGVGIWTLVQGNGVIANSGAPDSFVSGLSVGDNVFQWSIDNGPCVPSVTSDQVTITVFSQLQLPANAGPDQQVCSSQGVVTLSGNAAPYPASVLWELVSGSGSIASPTNVMTDVTGLALGDNVFSYTISNGPCSAPTTDFVTITVFDNNLQPASAGSDVEICLPQNAVTLNGNLAAYPATGLWTLISGGGTFADASIGNTTVTGIPVGSNTYRWTINNGPCAPSVSADEVTVLVFDNTQAPANAGIDQSFCEPVSSATLNGNAVIFPATGQWSLVSGAGSVVNPSNPNSQVNGLAVGENVFRWSLSNGPCAGAETFDEVSIFIFDDNQPAANAGADQFFCSPESNTTVTGSPVIFPATGQWTVISGTAVIDSPTSSTTQVSGLTIGETILQWSVSNGPCPGSNTSDQISLFVFDSNAPVADAGPDQSICSPQNSTVMAANSPIFPATGFWEVVSGSGIIQDVNSPTTQIDNLGVGEHVFRWTIDNGGCGAGTTSDEVTILVYSSDAPDAFAGEDRDLCTPVTSVIMSGSFPVAPGFGQWTLVSGSGVIADAGDPNTLVTGLGIGPNVFEWTVFNGPCANALTTDQVVINVFDGGAEPPFAGNDQELCSPDFDTQLQADPAVFPGIGTWSVIGGTGVFSNPNDHSATVSGLSIGFNVLRWSIDYSTCGAPFDDVNIIVYDSSQDPADAGPDQFICNTTTETTMAANAALSPGFGTWSVIQGTGNFVNANDPLTVVSNLSVGENLYVWELYTGGCLDPLLSRDTVAIYVYDNIEPPAYAGEDQFICTPLSEVVLEGSEVIFPAIGTWTLVQGSGVIADSNSEVTQASGLTVGENIFQWAVDNGPCPIGVTVDEVSVFVFDETQPSADAGVDQQFCTPVNSASLNGSNVIFPGSGAWTVLTGGGVIDDPTNPVTNVTGLTVGQHIFQWSVQNGPCAVPTSDVVEILIFDELNPVADAGEDQELCLPQTDTQLQGSTYIFPATGQWSVFAGTGIFADESDPFTSVSGLSVGENVFVWTVENGPCANSLTTDTVVIRLFDPLAALANAGPDQSGCTPGDSFVMAATPAAIPGFGTWSVESGSALIADVNDPATTISGLTVGETVLRWTIYNGPCSNSNSFDLITILLYDADQPAAGAGQDQSICTPQTSVTLDGNDVIFPASGQWTVTTGTGIFADDSDPATLVTDLSIGLNVFRWTITNGPCDPGVTFDEVSVFVFDNTQESAFAGDDQEICLPQTDVLLEGSELVGVAEGNWQLITGQGSIVDPQSSITQVTDLAQGGNVFVWSVDNGSCGVSSDTITVFVFNPDAIEADAGADTFLCTPISQYTLEGNVPDVPGVGTWDLISGTGSISDTNDPSAEVVGLTIGENVFSWTIYNGPCEEPTVDLVSIFVYDQNQPEADAGDDQELCLPLNETTLNGSPVIFPATGTWTLIEGSGVITDPTNPLTTVTDLGQGVNVFEWVIDNGPCADAITTDQVAVSVFNPDAPIADAGVDQEYCLPQTFTTMSATEPEIPGVGTWQLLSGSGVIADVNDPASAITGLSVGENVFQWTVYNGPCSVTNTTDLVSIFIYSDEQLPADAGPDQELCTPNTTAQLSGNEVIFPASGVWTLIQGFGVIQNPADPSTLVTDLAPGNNIFEWTITNGVCAGSQSSDQVTIFIFNSDQEDAYAGEDQELCLPVNTTTVQGTALTGAATGLWTLVSGGGTIVDPTNPVTELIDLPQGINVFEWTIDNGPCGMSSDQVSISVFNPDAPIADAGPDAEYCTPVSTHQMTGSQVEFPGQGTWILITGTATIEDPSNPNTLITGLTVGENIFIWQVYNGPCNPPTVDVMSIFIYNETTPDANAGPDQEICLPITEVVMSASAAEFPAIGTWAVVSSPGAPVIGDINAPNSVVSNLPLGTTVLSWTVDNGPCQNGITVDTVEIRVYDPNLPGPLAGEDQDICTPQSQVVMSASVPEDPNYGFWSLSSGSGVVSDINDPNATISGLAVGVSCFNWTIYNGVCANSLLTDEVCINVFNANQPAALAGPDQELCFPVTTAVMAGNEAIIPALGTWTVFGGDGDITDANNPLTTITNIPIGTNTFVWTIDNGPCPEAITSDQVNVLVFDPNAAPADAGADISICTPENCVTLGATAATDPQTGTWSFISSINGSGDVPFGTINNINDNQAELCALVVGVHTLQWELYNGPCDNNTQDTVVVFVYDATALVADAGSDQELCGDDSQTILEANTPVFPAIGTWTIVNSPGNPAIADANDPLSEISGLGIGVHTLVWTIDNGPCLAPTSDTLQIFVFDPDSPNASAGPDQLFCENLPDATMAGNTPIFPAFGTWSVISGGGEIADVNDPNTVINNIPLNENVFVWTVYNGACANSTTSDTISVFVNDLTVAAANAGPDLFLCGVPEDLLINGSPTVGLATSLWETVSGSGVPEQPTNNNTFVGGLTPGITTLNYTVDNGACGVSSDEMMITIFDPELPVADAGESLTICENEFVSFNLNASEAVFPSVGWWTIVDGPVMLSDSTSAEALVLSMGEIITELQDVPSTLVWNVDNGVCGTTTDTLLLILKDCLTLKIPDAFSPNGDGVNDEWIIPNIDSYPANTVKIFNRWGAEIFSAAPYSNGNAWDGISTHPATLGEGLPVSTYYYILDLGTGEEAYRGFVYLKR
jgi:gliding motility-associated-like protein